MPDYIVEPPDLILVEVLEALPGRPISGERLVRPDGKISLGFYGDVYVAGLTIPEVKEKIVLHLRKYLPDETLGLVESTTTASTIDDKTNEPSQIEPRDSDRVFVDVTAYNSKNYYILGDVLVPGKLPITGNETVLDAINYAGGLLPTAAPQNIRLVRPAPPGACCEQILPVNLAAITSGGDPTTNYQLMPGDRIVVYRDPIVRFTIFLDRLVAPFQTVVGSMLQTAFTIRYCQDRRYPVSASEAAAGAASSRPSSRWSRVPGSLSSIRRRIAPRQPGIGLNRREQPALPATGGRAGSSRSWASRIAGRGSSVDATGRATSDRRFRSNRGGRIAAICG